MTSFSPSPFRGPRRKLVLAFDVGTAYSGISYCILDPGQVPEIKRVTSPLHRTLAIARSTFALQSITRTFSLLPFLPASFLLLRFNADTILRFPAHEQISGASRIPTLIYYGRNGKVRAIGAEAMREGIYETAEAEEWIKTERFPLHLRPKTEACRHIVGEMPPLPLKKTVAEVLGDFLGYLFECASSYIQEISGSDLWASVKKDIDYVLSHPNGWGIIQRAQMRRAAVQAGLIPDTAKGHTRISFVMEGEAILHFSIQNGLSAGAMKRGDGVVIVDAAEDTVEVSAYSRIPQQVKDSFEEIAAPQCQFHGSTFVSIQARLFLRKLLEDSPFIDNLDHIVQCFDKTTKLRFRDIDEAQYIKFGSTRDNNDAYGIRFGQLKLQGTDVAKFFEPSVRYIVKAVLELCQSANRAVSHVVLVGSFAANDWLYNKVLESLRPLGFNVLRPENHVNIAVREGAVSFYLHSVRTRVSKVAYGHFCDIPYDPSDPEHEKREGNTFTSVSGSKRINDMFDIILPKNTQLSGAKEFRKAYSREFENRNELKNAEFSMWCYRGRFADPQWKNVDTDMYTKLCTVEVDLSHIPPTSSTKGSGETVQYFPLDYDLVLSFGLTELKVQVAWKEGSTEKRSPTKIVYDPDITRYN